MQKFCFENPATHEEEKRLKNYARSITTTTDDDTIFRKPSRIQQMQSQPPSPGIPCYDRL